LDALVVFVTVPTKREARIIARKLVEEKLARCVNLLPVESVFEWEGETEVVEEQLLVIKTVKKNFGRLEERVKQLHSYDTPEIIALPVERGSKDYLEWLTG